MSPICYQFRPFTRSTAYPLAKQDGRLESFFSFACSHFSINCTRPAFLSVKTFPFSTYNLIPQNSRSFCSLATSQGREHGRNAFVSDHEGGNVRSGIWGKTFQNGRWISLSVIRSIVARHCRHLSESITSLRVLLLCVGVSLLSLHLRTLGLLAVRKNHVDGCHNDKFLGFPCYNISIIQGW